MTLGEKIILEKLTGICPINFSGEEGTNVLHPSDGKTFFSANGAEEYEEPKQKVERYFEEIDCCLRQMEVNRENYAFRHLYSCRAVIGKLIVFCKKIVRKCLKWYIEPICNQQTEFNNAVTPAFGRLTQLQRFAFEQIREGYQQSEELLAQLQELAQEESTHRQRYEQEQNALREQLDMMRQQLCEARKELQDLREQGAFAEVVANEQVMKKSTAQSGEDMISEYVARVLGKRLEDVTYLDLGANHAKFLSNTYYFYQKGVRGVLVEANPALIGELKFYRSGDVILNRCIADTSGETVDFYVLNGDGLSTPDKQGAEAAIAENPILKIEQVVPVKTITVEEILDTYFDKTPTIVNLDIEGEEMNILNSIDFTKHRPLIMIIETIPYRKHLVVGLKNQEIIDFMASKNYIEYAFTGINSIFLDKEQIAEVLE
nr:FkbM family methyltransferase [uncultured Agathobaculum sp.]